MFSLKWTINRDQKSRDTTKSTDPAVELSEGRPHQWARWPWRRHGPWPRRTSPRVQRRLHRLPMGTRRDHQEEETSRKALEAKRESWRGLLAGCRAFTGGLHMVMSATPSVPTSIVTCIIVPAAMTGRPGCSLDHSGRPSSLVQAINSRRRRRPKFPGRYRHDIRTSQIFFVDLNKV